jgi:hypothetical protein
MIRRFLCAAALIAVSVTTASAHDASDSKAKVALVYDHVLPNVPGKSIRGVLVDMRPAALRRRMSTRSLLSSTRRSSRERSGVRSMTGR